MNPVQHPTAAILERIVKAEGNLQLDQWEQFTSLLWLVGEGSETQSGNAGEKQ